MADWSELQHDLLVLIVRRINLIEDYLNFRTVCKSWYSVATKENFKSDLPRVPWLMLAEDEDENTCRKFFSLSNGMILKKSIPGSRGKRCVECMGWLITVGKDEGEISMLHPFSGVQIQLPHQIQFLWPHKIATRYYRFNNSFKPWIFIRKAVLSANPSHTSDYILMVIEDDFHCLSMWRPGDLSWTRLPAYNGNINDVIYFNGNFYAIDFKGRIQIRDVGSEHGESHILLLLEPWIYDCLSAYLQFKEVGGLDMGVFNLADGSIQPHYDGVSLSRICPPIWVTPNPC